MLPVSREATRPRSRHQPAALPPDGERSRKISPGSTTRRSEIIEAAIGVIARDGIRACTVSALEHATGFARGHFSYHFTSKEKIIALAFATVGSNWATNQIGASAAPTARERLECQIRAAARWGQERPEYFRCLMNFRIEMMRDPSAFPRAQEIRTQFSEAAAATIRQAMADGDLRPDLDSSWEAHILFAIVDGFLMHAAMDVAFCPPVELADRVWQVVADRLLPVPGSP